MNQTTNYQLNQWEATDRILMSDFNSDNAKIDAALAELGAFRIESGTYTGTGNTVSKSLTLTRPPVLVIISSTASADLMFLVQGTAYGTVLLADTSSRFQSWRMRSAWSGNTVTWQKYYTDTDAKCFMDQSGVTYRYVALVSAQ